MLAVYYPHNTLEFGEGKALRLVRLVAGGNVSDPILLYSGSMGIGASGSNGHG